MGTFHFRKIFNLMTQNTKLKTPEKFFIKKQNIGLRGRGGPYWGGKPEVGHDPQQSTRTRGGGEWKSDPHIRLMRLTTSCAKKYFFW